MRAAQPPAPAAPAPAPATALTPQESPAGAPLPNPALPPARAAAAPAPSALQALPGLAPGAEPGTSPAVWAPEASPNRTLPGTLPPQRAAPPPAPAGQTFTALTPLLGAPAPAPAAQASGAALPPQLAAVAPPPSELTLAPAPSTGGPPAAAGAPAFGLSGPGGPQRVEDITYTGRHSGTAPPLASPVAAPATAPAASPAAGLGAAPAPGAARAPAAQGPNPIGSPASGPAAALASAPAGMAAPSLPGLGLGVAGNASGCLYATAMELSGTLPKTNEASALLVVALGGGAPDSALGAAGVAVAFEGSVAGGGVAGVQPFPGLPGVFLIEARCWAPCEQPVPCHKHAQGTSPSVPAWECSTRLVMIQGYISKPFSGLYSLDIRDMHFWSIKGPGTLTSNQCQHGKCPLPWCKWRFCGDGACRWTTRTSTWAV